MTATLDPSVSADLLAELGFLHVPGLPLHAGNAYLFVALRAKPTLNHFDPERIDYWVSEDGRGTRSSLDWSVRMPFSTDYSWGLVRVVDRKGVFNSFLSFGGRLTADRIGNVKATVLSSEAPILAHGGHSQGRERDADRVASFFARLRAAAGRSHTFETRLCNASPVALYAAFTAECLSRYRRSELLRALEPRTMATLARERSRLRSESPEAWIVGVALADALARSTRGDGMAPRRLVSTGRPALI